MSITDTDFIEAMRQAVAERGEDYVYDRSLPGWAIQIAPDDPGTCVYVTPEGEPACIIGLAIAKTSPDDLPDHQYTGNAADALEGTGVSLAVRQAAWHAQAIQDRTQTWGDAYKEFVKALPPALRPTE